MSLKERVTAQDACDLLNELLKNDHDCISSLITYRKKCNESIANHETVQCQLSDKGITEVGLIGILNGMFGIRNDGMGAICYEFDETGKITCFKITPEEEE